MGDENRHKKEFHFDLSYAALKERGLEKKAYSLIKAFMEQHGFDHIQYSGYRSREPMFTTEAYKVLGELHETFSWFHPCLKAAALTNVPVQMDAKVYLDHLVQSTSSLDKTVPGKEAERTTGPTFADKARQVANQPSSPTRSPVRSEPDR